MSLAQKCILNKIFERSTCTHLHHLDLNSEGQRYLYRNGKKILCVRQNYVLVEFFWTLFPEINSLKYNYHFCRKTRISCYWMTAQTKGKSKVKRTYKCVLIVLHCSVFTYDPSCSKKPWHTQTASMVSFVSFPVKRTFYREMRCYF